ncbi:hypothetical protein Efla_004485 [Eimeria flavescens]
MRSGRTAAAACSKSNMNTKPFFFIPPCAPPLLGWPQDAASAPFPQQQQQQSCSASVKALGQPYEPIYLASPSPAAAAAAAAAEALVVRSVKKPLFVAGVRRVFPANYLSCFPCMLFSLGRMEDTSKCAAGKPAAGGAAGRAAAVAVAAAGVAVGYQMVCRILALMFPYEAWGPGRGVQLAEQYMPVILCACALYLPAVYTLQQVMATRAPLKCQTAAFVWNLSLSALSWLGALTALLHQPQMFFSAWFPEKDFCPPVRVVITLFTLTKAVEFGDTFVLILKKKPLSFLHVYHHLTVSLYCWHAQLVNADFAHAFALMNLAVHALMYLYFALCCCNTSSSSGSGSSKGLLQRVLRRCRPFITVLQILQMLVGAHLAFQAVLQHTDPRQILNAQLAVAMYSSYALLFMHLYCSSYLPHLSSSRVILLLLLHIFAAAGAYKLFCVAHGGRVLVHLAAAAAASLSLSHLITAFNNSSSSSSSSGSSKHKMLLALQLMLNLLVGAAQVAGKPQQDSSSSAHASPTAAVMEAAAAGSNDAAAAGSNDAAAAGSNDATAAGSNDAAAAAAAEGNGVGEAEGGPSRSLSVSSTTADLSTLSSSLSSNEDYEPTPRSTKCAAAAAEQQQPQQQQQQPLPEKQQANPVAARHRDSLLRRVVSRKTELRLDWMSAAAAAAAAAAPAVYGQLCCGDWALGFCVFVPLAAATAAAATAERREPRAVWSLQQASAAADEAGAAAASSVRKKGSSSSRSCCWFSTEASSSNKASAAAAAPQRAAAKGSAAASALQPRKQQQQQQQQLLAAVAAAAARLEVSFNCCRCRGGVGYRRVAAAPAAAATAPAAAAEPAAAG